MVGLKHIGAIAWCAGIAVFIGLIMWSGLGEISSAVLSVGWGMLFIVLIRVATVSVAGAGWWVLFPTRRRLSLGSAIFFRFVREAVNTLLPLTQVGGDIVGARLLTFWAVPGPLAVASVIIDVLMQAATLFLFAAVGLVVLVALGADQTPTWIAATGLGLAIPMLGGFYLAQRGAGRRLLYLVLSRLKFDGTWMVLGTVDAVYQSLATIYARRSNIAASGLVHMLGWLIGVAEVWIVLACMGHPVNVGDALVIESLVQAVRGGAFVIPSAVGAQEVGLILLCGLFGIPADQALALSLIKRAADIVVGLPGLVALQIVESGRLAASIHRTARARAPTVVQTESP
jgi:putative membrane protein